jgi:hypothetical protein
VSVVPVLASDVLCSRSCGIRQLPPLYEFSNWYMMTVRRPAVDTRCFGTNKHHPLKNDEGLLCTIRLVHRDGGLADNNCQLHAILKRACRMHGQPCHIVRDIKQPVRHCSQFRSVEKNQKHLTQHRLIGQYGDESCPDQVVKDGSQFTPGADDRGIEPGLSQLWESNTVLDTGIPAIAAFGTVF